MKSGKLLLSIFILSLFTMVSCSDKKSSSDKSVASKNEQKKTKKKEASLPVEATLLSRGRIQLTYNTITTLEAENEAFVVARTNGIIEKIIVEEGDHVKKGQILAQLDVEQLRLEAEQLNATLKKLENELHRQQQLFKRRLGSSDALDKARFEYESQQAQYNLSKLKIRYATIRSPINGVVSERLVKTGNLVSINDKLFKITDPESLAAILHLPEKELINIKKQQQVFLQVDAFDKEVMQGVVERVRPIIDTDTGTFKVTVKINNRHEKLKAGMFGRISIVFDTHDNALLLPQQAIITQDNRSHVFTVQKNEAIQTPIKTGYSQNGFVEVTSGLKDHDVVVVTGQQILKHKSKVEIVGDNAVAIKDFLKTHQTDIAKTSSKQQASLQ